MARHQCSLWQERQKEGLLPQLTGRGVKTCSEPGCSYPVFSHHFCKYHQSKRTDKGLNPSQSKAKQPRSLKDGYEIPRRTKKRQNDEKLYLEQAREFYAEAVATGTNTCIFCGEKVKYFEGLHHWLGRMGKLLLDKRYWSIVHDDCHLFYHRATVAQMRDRFGEMFFKRLQRFNSLLAEKILNREQK